MKVLTYLKDLPVKLVNENKGVIGLEGATLYIDEESNRYAYVCFNNYMKKPFFSLILELSQYDVGGHLIKKEKYYVPNCYGDRGKTALEKPINIDKECEGMEIEITLAVFSNRIFANNQLLKNNDVRFSFPRLSDNDPLMPTGNAASFAFPSDVKEEEKKPEDIYRELGQMAVSSAPATEENKEEKPFDELVEPQEPVKEEKNTDDIYRELIQGKQTLKEEPKDEKAEEPAPEAKPEEVNPDDELPVVLPNENKRNKLLHVVLPIVFGIVAVGMVLAIYFLVRLGVPSTPYRP